MTLHCDPLCPFVACPSCSFDGTETVAAQANGCPATCGCKTRDTPHPANTGHMTTPTPQGGAHAT